MGRRLAVLLLVLWASPVFAGWTISEYEGRRYVPIEDVAAFYKLEQQVSSALSFSLNNGRQSIHGEPWARDIYINNVKFMLCFPVIIKDGRTWFSAMDVTKIIDPVLRPGKILDASPIRTVILDAGHGGLDSGAKGPLGYEKDATLDVVLRAKDLLEDAGYLVRLTRMTDVYVPLEERAAVASKFPRAIFVSIHFNKGYGGTGVETYCLAPRGVPSMDEPNLSYGDFIEYPGHAYDTENIALAMAMHLSLLSNLHVTDRGIKRSRFVVVRDINMPGVLIEGGFMNTPQDARLIASPQYRQAIAQSIVDGVKLYGKAIEGLAAYGPVTARATATPIQTASAALSSPKPLPSVSSGKPRPSASLAPFVTPPKPQPSASVSVMPTPSTTAPKVGAGQP